MTSVKTRFAPSPTGLIHLGNARTAFFNLLYAHSQSGKFMLRIEDSDQERSRIEHVADLMEDFQWLGLHWDEGPEKAEVNADNFQSQRGAIYAKYYDQLEQSDRAYPCFCSPKELELSRKRQLGAGQPPRYSGKCAHLTHEERTAKFAAGEKATLRFKVDLDDEICFEDLVRGSQKFSGKEIGDFIIRREDGTPAFFFCNAVDDALMQVSHVMRGEDHLTNTPRQILILRSLELPIPQYAHFSLILGDDGAPLSKRNGSQSLKDLKQRGFIANGVLNYLARLGHKYENETCMTLEQLSSQFTVTSLGKAPARYDEAQLIYWQKEAVQAADENVITDWLGQATLASVPETHQSEFISLVQSNCVFPEDAKQWAEVLFSEQCAVAEDANGLLEEAGGDFYNLAATLTESFPDDYNGFLNELKQQSGLKGKKLFQPLRLALTGRLDGPELTRVYSILGADAARKRFETIAKRF